MATDKVAKIRLYNKTTNTANYESQISDTNITMYVLTT